MTLYGGQWYGVLSGSDGDNHVGKRGALEKPWPKLEILSCR